MSLYFDQLVLNSQDPVSYEDLPNGLNLDSLN